MVYNSLMIITYHNPTYMSNDRLYTFVSVVSWFLDKAQDISGSNDRIKLLKAHKQSTLQGGSSSMRTFLRRHISKFMVGDESNTSMDHENAIHNRATWGPHFWKLFHVMAVCYQPLYHSTFVTFIALFRYLLPCAECSRHFREHTIRFPLRAVMKSPLHITNWSIRIHNMANSSRKKPCATITSRPFNRSALLEALLSQQKACEAKPKRLIQLPPPPMTPKQPHRLNQNNRGLGHVQRPKRKSCGCGRR